MLHNFVYEPSRKFENCQKNMIYLLIISYLKIHLYTVVTGGVMVNYTVECLSDFFLCKLEVWTIIYFEESYFAKEHL